MSRHAQPSAREIVVGVMRLDVGGRDAETLTAVTKTATARFAEVLQREQRLNVRSLTFSGVDLRPERDGYRALDFVQLGLNEKTERRLAFLLIVTAVEFDAASLSYLLALPSQLTNVAVLSTRRLVDENGDDSRDAGLLGDRLGALMLHSFGRLLNLGYHAAPSNYMARVSVPADLDRMGHFDEAQYERMAATLPREANDRFSDGPKMTFVLRQILANLPRIVRGALRANPLRIASKLPRMIATALSVIIVLVFGAETWDFAASVTATQLGIFVAACFAGATFVLYRAFAFELVTPRHGHTSESAVVTAGATYLALVLTLACLFVLFGVLMYGVVVFVFPDALMSNWTSDKDGSTLGAHVRVTVFLAAVGVLSGSLGGSADSQSVIRNVLFATDET